MKKLLFIFLLCLITSSAFGQFFAPNQKPMLGLQVNKGHQLGDPAGAWFFNEGSGNKVSDLSGNGHTGTFVNSTYWGAGRYGVATKYNQANSDYISIGTDLFKYTGGFTITANVYLTSEAGGNFPCIIENTDNNGNNGWMLVWNTAANTFRFYCHNGVDWDYAESATVSLNTQYCVTGVHRPSGSIEIYVNGLVGSGDTTTLNYGTTNCNIGVYAPSGTPSYWDGTIDNVMIHSRDLTASEIALLYREPFCMFEYDPIELWSAATQGGAPPAGIPILRRRRECA